MKLHKPAILETSYPPTFRAKDAETLATYIKRGESVCLVAMKKMGIANFCRFFCFHPQVKKRYFDKEANKFLFIYCDLNCLRELSERAFFEYVTSSLHDAIRESALSEKVKSGVKTLVENRSQITNLQGVFDTLVQLIKLVSSETDVTVVFFFIRFDRLHTLFHSLFFAALQSLADVARFRLLYVTTSVRPLKDFYYKDLADSETIFFPQSCYLKPISLCDLHSIAKQLNLTKDYDQTLTSQNINTIFSLGGGHIMLTRLILMAWSEGALNGNGKTITTEALLKNERIYMACEEIWTNLTKPEKDFLSALVYKKRSMQPSSDVHYLVDTGTIIGDRSGWRCFSPLFEQWIINHEKHLRINHGSHELTPKERLLLNVLTARENSLCDRDSIIEGVWPEYQQVDLTVSDWAIDRLVSRLRHKLQERNDGYEILTMRGKGFKLIKMG